MKNKYVKFTRASVTFINEIKYLWTIELLDFPIRPQEKEPIKKQDTKRNITLYTNNKQTNKCFIVNQEAHNEQYNQ
jgi:hypothetical protein